MIFNLTTKIQAIETEIADIKALRTERRPNKWTLAYGDIVIAMETEVAKLQAKKNGIFGFIYR